jgi:hypothetical protein
MWEDWIDPKFGAFVREIARATSWNSAWPVEAVCLLAAALMSLATPHMNPNLHGISATYDASRALGLLLLTGQCYWVVCLTVYRYRLLLFRWLWRLGLWSYFLRRRSRLEPHLVPTHSDGVAGLGFLEVVHMHFNLPIHPIRFDNGRASPIC